MLCIEKRLDCEVEGVRVGLVVVGEDSDGLKERVSNARGDGVVPYGFAVRKLYAGSM